MRKMIFVLALSLGSIASAEAAERNANPSLSIRSASNVYVLNTTSRSCKLQITGDGTEEDDMGPLSAIFRDLSFTWKGPNALTLYWVRFRFQSPGIDGGQYDFTYSGSGLNYLFSGANSIAPSDQPYFSRGDCVVAIGDIPVRDKTKAMFGTGSIYFYGTTKKGDQDVPATSETTFTFRYDGEN